MTDYKEEQSNEMEALLSIYDNDINVLEEEPFHSFEILLKAQTDQFDEDNSVTLQFTYVADYPDAVPAMDISDSSGLEDELIEQLREIMDTSAEESVGMVMVFTVVSAVQDRLDDMVVETRNRREDEERRKRREEEERERNHFEGTRVSVETFLAWKVQFDEEMIDSKTKKILAEASGKPTGRELFEADNTLDDSDMKFLEEEDGEEVEVDDSLFEDLGDLELDAELE